MQILASSVMGLAENFLHAGLHGLSPHCTEFLKVMAKMLSLIADGDTHLGALSGIAIPAKV